jgi:hypothetical protein
VKAMERSRSERRICDGQMLDAQQPADLTAPRCENAGEKAMKTLQDLALPPHIYQALQAA